MELVRVIRLSGKRQLEQVVCASLECRRRESVARGESRVAGCVFFLGNLQITCLLTSVGV